MERSSKLADLKLVSKYYPVANYSYPQRDRRSHNGQSLSRASNSSDTASLGSDGSPPGLIDDRTDSEVSLDDDYQYHTHATELWNTFWKPGAEGKDPALELQPRKQYPALIPSPQQRRKLGLEDRRIAAWPLPEGPRPRTRKAAATYSAFPKLIPLPPRTTSLAPSWQCSRSKQRPQRPPRPDEKIIEKPQGQTVKPLQVEVVEPPREEIIEPPHEEVVEQLQEDVIKCTEIEIVKPSSQRSSPVMSYFAMSPEPYKTNFSRPSPLACPSSASTDAGAATAAAQPRAPIQATGDGRPMQAQSPRHLSMTPQIVYPRTNYQGESDKVATF
ncbi:hypothetical protein G7Z17_g12280 [Cylindrodendrum hubeiense]|uniref:Uncharacterized protein n=1 Tax=Cylindrodendrum hubeiense TaxID=595255 RepID=A0A9P5L5M9_9HYPO|nr:hypothetical protein G7Z17_g12280 [Cylindrodendrum hubeiense]